jgi:cysteine desulfurase/selenocysteine lyase
MNTMIYLDNAATSYPKPGVVYEFMRDFYRDHGVSPGRSGFDASLEAEEIVMGTRKLLTELFNGGSDPNRLTFSYNASDSLNMIIQGLAEKGDHVVTTMLEHNSVLRPLHHLRINGIVEVTHVGFDARGYVHPDDIAGAIKKNTKMVIVNHCSNVIGTIQPLAEIGAVCRKAGVLFIVDTTQSAGSVPIDMQKMGIDVVVFTGHKGLLGPTGIGGSYVRENVPVRCTRFGGTGVRSAQETHLDEFPYRLECGTMNLMGVAGLNAGVRWLLREGIDTIHAREMMLWEKLRKGLAQVGNVVTYCAEGPDNHGPVLSLNVRNFEAGDVGTILDVDYGIACRTGLHCAPKVHQGLGTDSIHGSVRLSVGPFNTEAHITQAIRAVTEIAAMRK